jgi:hypothetical protein
VLDTLVRGVSAEQISELVRPFGVGSYEFDNLQVIRRVNLMTSIYST